MKTLSITVALVLGSSLLVLWLTPAPIQARQPKFGKEVQRWVQSDALSSRQTTDELLTRLEDLNKTLRANEHQLYRNETLRKIPVECVSIHYELWRRAVRLVKKN